MTVQILHGDCRDVLKALPDNSVHACITSPPYWGLRSYLPDGHPMKAREIGSEPTVHDWVATMVEVFREVRRVLRPDGTLWLNLGDSYANNGKWGGATGGKHSKYLHGGESRIGREQRHTGLKPKDLIGQPWRVAFALQADGWWLRQELIWAKRNPMPESVTDRFTKAHEQVFLLSKSDRYYFDLESVKEPARENTHQRRAGTGVGFGHGYDAVKKPRYKTPDGWDTTKGEGGHGSFHKAGREKGRVLDQGVGRIGGHPDNPPEGARRAPKETGSAMDSAYADGKSARMGRGAGWRERKLAEAGSGTKNNGSFDDAMAVMPATRNPRTVRWLASEPFKGAHYATYPAELIRPFVLAGCPEGGTVLDPFGGSGTTGLVADQHGRNAILIDIDERNLPMAQARITADAPLFSAATVSPIASVCAADDAGVCAAPNLPEAA